MKGDYRVGQRLVHYTGSVWEVQATDLPGDGQWENGMIALAGDYRIACLDQVGLDANRVTRVHADYLHGNGWRSARS